MIKIEKDIPIPLHTGAGRPCAYPFKEMDVGDSFWSDVKSIAGIASKFGERNNMKFISRKENGGRRVWRLT